MWDYALTEKDKAIFADRLKYKLHEKYKDKYDIYYNRDNYIEASLYNELDKPNRLTYINILINRKYGSNNEEPVIMVRFEGTNDSSKIIGDLYGLLIADYIYSKNLKKAFQLNHEEYIIAPIYIKPNLNDNIRTQITENIKNAIKKRFRTEETERIWLFGYSDRNSLFVNTEKTVLDCIDSIEKYNKSKANDWEKLLQTIKECTINTGINDLAHEHDHYLYGTPKKNDLKEV